MVQDGFREIKKKMSARSAQSAQSAQKIVINPFGGESAESLEERVISTLILWRQAILQFRAHTVHLGNIICKECGAKGPIGATNVPNFCKCPGEDNLHKLFPMVEGFYYMNHGKPMTDDETYSKIALAKVIFHHSGNTNCSCRKLMPCTTYLDETSLPSSDVCEKILRLRFTDADRADRCSCGLMKKVWTDAKHHKDDCNVFHPVEDVYEKNNNNSK